jgi:glycosyltransferase involved in cell wall biosynthesis
MYPTSNNGPRNTVPILYIVMPCYNEEKVLETSLDTISLELQILIAENLISQNSGIIAVDDGSQDNTWSILENYCLSSKLVSGIKLSKNVGHQNALLAGLMKAKELSDCVISIDADLQDDVSVFRDFVLRFYEGYEIVYGIRKSRAIDTWFKRESALTFYRMMHKMGVNMQYNHADYRLMSKRALYQLEKFTEVNLFLRGIVPLIGLPATSIYYDRKERAAGESKYPFKKMINFAIDGITSFSLTPIRFVSVSGVIISTGSIVSGIYTLASKLFGSTQSGWSSLMLSVWFIGGVQLLALGVIGEYIGKIYKEVKHRPAYIVETEVGTISKDLNTTLLS